MSGKSQIPVEVVSLTVARFGVKHMEVHLSQGDHVPPSTCPFILKRYAKFKVLLLKCVLVASTAY